MCCLYRQRCFGCWCERYGPRLSAYLIDFLALVDLSSSSSVLLQATSVRSVYLLSSKLKWSESTTTIYSYSEDKLGTTSAELDLLISETGPLPTGAHCLGHSSVHVSYQTLIYHPISHRVLPPPARRGFRPHRVRHPPERHLFSRIFNYST